MIEGSKVLLVDDNNEIINILTDFLTLNGCTVHSAGTGEKGLELLRREEIEIAVLDVQLPDTNGISLLDAVKTADPTIGVIMMTGYYDPNFIVESMRKGASDFLLKPFEFDKLMLVMMRVRRERSLLVEKQTILSSLEDKKKIEVLNRELQKKIRELTTMYHISNKLNSLSIFDDVYTKMTSIAREILDAESCGYYVVDNDNEELILYREECSNGSRNQKRISLSEGHFWRSLSEGRHVISDDKIYLPMFIKGERIGCIAIKPKGGAKAKAPPPESDVFFLKLIAEKASTQIENRMLYESLFESVLHTLKSLIAAINRRDLYTEGHCQRVTSASLVVAEKLGLSDYERDVIRVVSPIHDLGKVGIPDSVLLKPSKLSDAEYGMMKGHPIYGEEIMNRFEILSKEAKIIRHHHERFDGTGYPDALQRSEIPVCSRVIAVCDAYDAMVTNRPYRRSLGKEEALAEIRRCRGTQFDPEVADCFVEAVEADTRDEF